jgi:hypothetical protein
MDKNEISRMKLKYGWDGINEILFFSLKKN